MLLLDLPEVPIFHIFRYLDTGSLETMLQTSRSTFDYICRNKKRLAQKHIVRVLIQRYHTDRMCTTYMRQGRLDCVTEVRVVYPNEEPPSYHFFSRVPLSKEEIYNYPRCNHQNCKTIHNGPWTTWLAKKMWDIEMIYTALIMPQEWEVEAVEAENRMIPFFVQTRQMKLVGPIFEDPLRRAGDVVAKFCGFFRTNSLTICFKGMVNIKRLMTEPFYDYLRTLKIFATTSSPGYGKLFKLSEIELPIDIFKFPSRCSLEGGVLFPIANLKNVLKIWWNCEQSLDSWVILLKNYFADSISLSNALEIPNTIEANGGLIFTNKSGNRIRMTRDPDPSVEFNGVVRWSLKQIT